jgi:putative hydrolase of the HAD superfamily
MIEVTTLFWDVGGVLLTNAWDQAARRRATDRFALDAGEVETRHDQVVAAFETGQMTLDEYFRNTVFHEPRAFSPDEFRDFMFAQSQPFPEVLRIAGELRRTLRYLMAALNNESLELNLYRIRQFDLRSCLGVFFSSCFLRARKPHPDI